MATKKWVRVFVEVKDQEEAECLAVIHRSERSAREAQKRLGGIVMLVQTSEELQTGDKLQVTFPQSLELIDLQEKTLMEIEELEALYRLK